MTAAHPTSSDGMESWSSIILHHTAIAYKTSSLSCTMYVHQGQLLLDATVHDTHTNQNAPPFQIILRSSLSVPAPNQRPNISPDLIFIFITCLLPSTSSCPTSSFHQHGRKLLGISASSFQPSTFIAPPAILNLQLPTSAISFPVHPSSTSRQSAHVHTRSYPKTISKAGGCVRPLSCAAS